MSICAPCKFAGKLLGEGKIKEAVANHQLCQDVQAEAGTTWCDCQHQTTHSVVRKP